MKRIVIAGGSGYLGGLLKTHLQDQDFEVKIMSRGRKAEIGWDGRTVGAWRNELEGIEAVINLSGESIAQKWTIQAQQGIIASRVESTRALGQAISQCDSPPRQWINASAVGIYGDRGDTILTEESEPGDPNSFLVKCCAAWEAAHDEFTFENTTMAKVRIGFVCGKQGGGLPVLTKLAKGFIGGAVGNGKQYMSWIHEHDLARLFTWIVQGDRQGIFNGSAPNPVTNADFMAQLRAHFHRPWAPAAPAFALQLASVIGAPDPDILLMSQRAVPEAALRDHFEFDFPELKAALSDLT